MKDIRKTVNCALALLCSAGVLLGSAVKANALTGQTVTADGKYHVVDFGKAGEEFGAYDHYDEAAAAFDEAAASYENAGIVLDEKVMKAEYAIITFKTTDACDYNVSYTTDPDEIESSVNGCYGIDAAYISTNDDGSKAEFQISGVNGWADINDVSIIPLQDVGFRLTSWAVNDGHLYHQIKNETEDNYFYALIDRGSAPEWLNENETYYSYDGHYFYYADSLIQLLDDAGNRDHSHAVNADDPWYDYYQYVPSRTITTISAGTVSDYLQNKAGIHEQIIAFHDNDVDSVDDTLTASQFYGNIPAFWQYQYQYGVNAMMSLAISTNESANGRSSLSFTGNNLFGHAAYDTQAEADAGRFSTVANSIYSHDKYYISGTFASPLKAQYHGSFFGDKACGMNVSYSNDPYWGEKSASLYRKLDEENGRTDRNSYKLAIRTGINETDVYAEPDGKALYSTGTLPGMSFAVIGENDDGSWLKIQEEATLDEEGRIDLSYNYDFENDIGWIKADAVQKIINRRGSGDVPFAKVTFDSDGGSFAGGASAVEYAVPAGRSAECVAPERAHSLFTGWSQSTDSISEDTVFKAQYREVSSIEMMPGAKTAYEVNDRLDLTNAVLTVHFADGSDEQVQVLSSMASGYDTSGAGTQTVTVSYGGCQTSYTIEVSVLQDSIRSAIKSEITAAIDEYGDWTVIQGEDAEKIINIKKKIDANVQPYLTIAQMRSFSKMLRASYQNRIRYIVDRNDYGLGVSGLDTSIPLGDSLTRNRFTKDTYRVRISGTISDEAEAAMRQQASYLGLGTTDRFTVQLLLNYEDAETSGPVVFSIRKPVDAKEGEVYTVLCYSGSGTVEKCYTRQSAGKITFMANQPGEFMLTSILTDNVYDSDDPEEAVSYENSSFDFDRAIARITVIFAALAAVLITGICIKRHKIRKKKAKVLQKKREKAKRRQGDLDVTKAITIIDTQVLHLDEIEEALEEEEKTDAEQ